MVRTVIQYGGKVLSRVHHFFLGSEGGGSPGGPQKTNDSGLVVREWAEFHMLEKERRTFRNKQHERVDHWEEQFSYWYWSTFYICYWLKGPESRGNQVQLERKQHLLRSLWKQTQQMEVSERPPATKTITLQRRKWQPTPVFLPGESQGRGSLVGCRLWGRTESDTTEVT